MRRENLVALGGESFSSNRDPESDSFVQLYQRTHCTFFDQEKSNGNLKFPFRNSTKCASATIRNKLKIKKEASVESKSGEKLNLPGAICKPSFKRIEIDDFGFCVIR